MAAIGKAAPAFKLSATGDQNLTLRDFKGQWLIVYFYPKDNTSGCTREAQDFASQYKKLRKLDAEVLGVSRDSIASHERFRSKFNLPFHLLSDPDEKLCNAFDVIKEKKLYGRTYMGIVRSTFLIDPQSKISHIWSNIKVPGHVEKVVTELEHQIAQ